MIHERSIESTPEAAALSPHEGEKPTNQFTAADVAAILHERRWLDRTDVDATVARVFRPGDLAPKSAAFPSTALGTSEEAGYSKQDMETWLAEAAALLGPHCADRDSLAELLRLIFHYDAQEILSQPESHVILAREGAREVIRELAHLVFESPEVDSDRFKEIISSLKTKLRFRGRELLHPIRLALAGRAAEGELDRVILLLDRAARLPFRMQVKTNRQRMLEFCAALE